MVISPGLRWLSSTGYGESPPGIALGGGFAVYGVADGYVIGAATDGQCVCTHVRFPVAGLKVGVATVPRGPGAGFGVAFPGGAQATRKLVRKNYCEGIECPVIFVPLFSSPLCFVVVIRPSMGAVLLLPSSSHKSSLSGLRL